MAINKIKRNEETRQATSKEENYSFEDTGLLDIPQSVTDKFANQGMSLRWIRIDLNGQDDYKNVGKRQREGWTFVTPDEVPELGSTTAIKEGGRYNGVVSSGDVALAKMPTNKMIARQEHYIKKHQQQEDSLDSTLRAQSDSRMPITNSSKSTVTKGREPRFQR
jgi:hypothetical protein